MLLSDHALYAQRNEIKAKRLADKGRVSMIQKQYKKAEQYLRKSIHLQAEYMDAYIALGELYILTNEFDKTADIFSLASKNCSGCVHSFAYPLASALFRSRQYDKALSVLNNWKLPPDLSKDMREKVSLLKRSVEFGKKSLTSKQTPLPLPLDNRVNTKFDEYYPSISPNDSILVFTRRVNGMDEDFYVAHRDSCGGWLSATNMGEPPNSSKQEGAQFISADRRYLFFMRCDNRSPNGWERGGCDLYFSYCEGEVWSQPIPFRATINTPAFEGMPSLSSDNKELFFVSNREGGYGGYDIWVTRFEDGLWQIPENLGPEVNTPYNETAPFIAPDNKTLYFTSDGHPGFGGNDIFYSKRVKGTWSEPINMGYPLNSTYDDVSFCLAAKGDKAYFASDRSGGEGRMDIYEIELPLESRPEPYTFVYGIVYDSITKKRLTYAQMEWYDVETGHLEYLYQSNRGDASFMSAVALDKPLRLKVMRDGYADFEDTIVFSTQKISVADTFHIAMLSDTYKPPLQDTLIFTINYQANQLEVSDSTLFLINEILMSYKDLANSEFIINGHTDDLGKVNINAEYSLIRAKMVSDYIISLGVNEEKITTKGWADANPLFANDTEENRYKNRRVEIIVRKPKG